GHDHVHLLVLQHRLPLRRGRLHELDLVLGVAELAGDIGGHVYVETGVGVSVLVSQARLVELDPDPDHVPAAGVTTVAFTRVAALGSGVPAGLLLAGPWLGGTRSKGEGPHGRQCGQRYSRRLHPGLLRWLL